MFKIIKRILLTNKSNTYLGRWNVDKPVEVINKTIDWSNVAFLSTNSAYNIRSSQISDKFIE